jgi:hypothetical protein
MIFWKKSTDVKREISGMATNVSIPHTNSQNYHSKIDLLISRAECINQFMLMTELSLTRSMLGENGLGTHPVIINYH